MTTVYYNRYIPAEYMYDVMLSRQWISLPCYFRIMRVKYDKINVLICTTAVNTRVSYLCLSRRMLLYCFPRLYIYYIVMWLLFTRVFTCLQLYLSSSFFELGQSKILFFNSAIYTNMGSYKNTTLYTCWWNITKLISIRSREQNTKW